MIVPITGKVSYSITLDPTVWIFDDRKILLEDAFIENERKNESNEWAKLGQRWDKEVGEEKPRTDSNHNISKREGEKILKNSYVIPIKEFVNKAEIHEDAKTAVLLTENNKEVELAIDELTNGYVQFALKGKPLKEDGPIYFLYRDGSNKENPIKHVKKIVIR
ncbi:hypothetical protein D8M04_10105 [Oceanobacillus piezotolerans]|uniref:Peptidyl-prolyl cis-trans isomerase n=1 Tax=Oceanobacillus piezotolerans TaxID=2448030 RepID=A0A498DN86_9BACI|nr:hypothetical protein [Oceanobacillus piezotolerans]RLL45202.1 hypothetical protein D8M04_10105 [Oceanobacillus piezotolerans]